MAARAALAGVMVTLNPSKPCAPRSLTGGRVELAKLGWTMAEERLALIGG